MEGMDNMSVTDNEVIDGIACDGETLILEIYDHLDFEGAFEYDHMMILQEKLNTYIFFINTRQYVDVYPDREFSTYLIRIHFLHEIADSCRKYIRVSNEKLLSSNIKLLAYRQGSRLC